MNACTSWLTPAALAAILLFPAAPVLPAAPLSSAQVTETKNEVRYRPAAGVERPAQVADRVQGADVLRTGERSQAEIQFGDKTVSRLGSKTVFSFQEGGREFRPGNGTTLISMPKGAGGGRIVTPAVTAAIEGTTVIVEIQEVPAKTAAAAPRLLSKVIFLEGSGHVMMTERHADCAVDQRPIGPGQMIAQFADDHCLAPVVDIDLGLFVKRSRILTGFATLLPSTPAIADAVARQQTELRNGTLEGPAATANIYSLNPATGAEGVLDPLPNQPSGGQGQIADLGNGFYLSSRPIPGSTWSKVQGGNGYVCRFP